MMPENPFSDAPPVEQGDYQPPRSPAVWPKVIGIIAIVLGALGILGNLWGLIAPFVMEAIMGSMGNDPNVKASIQAQKDYMGWTLGGAGLNLIAALVLLVGGIGMCMRRRWGIGTIKVWIPFKMLAEVVSVIGGYLVMQATLKAMSGQGATPSPGLASMMGVIGIVFGLGFGWAFPIFMWVWLSRRKVRAEIANWS